VTQKVTSVDSILLTELFFSGLLNELTDPECLALFSVLVQQVRAGNGCKESEADISENFTRAFNFLELETEKLIETEKECKVNDQV